MKYSCGASFVFFEGAAPLTPASETEDEYGQRKGKTRRFLVKGIHGLIKAPSLKWLNQTLTEEKKEHSLNRRDFRGFTAAWHMEKHTMTWHN